MENLLVSACLLGVTCRYDGKSKLIKEFSALKEKYNLIPVCPEIFGGLATPRSPAERNGALVLAKNGRDVTAEYEHGAYEVLRLAEMFGCKKAVLKERSPSCGSGKIYDGTFSKTVIDGYGVAAAVLLQNGVEVFGESRLAELL